MKRADIVEWLGPTVQRYACDGQVRDKEICRQSGLRLL